VLQLRESSKEDLDDARSILHDVDTQCGLLPGGGSYKDSNQYGYGGSGHRRGGWGFQTDRSAEYDDSDHYFYSI
jgi:hypothetical protein